MARQSLRARSGRGPWRARRAAASLCLALLLGAAGAVRAADPTVVRHVLPAGQEAAVQRLVDPGADGLGGACRVQDIAIREDRIGATYEGPDCRFTLELTHRAAGGPDAVRTERFSVVFTVPPEGGRLPDPVRAALLAHLRAYETDVAWRALYVTADLGQWSDAATRAIQEAANLRRHGEPERACALLRTVFEDGAAGADRRREAAGAALACDGPVGAAARAALEGLRAAWADPARAAADGAHPLTGPALVALALGDEAPVREAVARLLADGEGERACRFGAAAASSAWGLERPAVALRLLEPVLAARPDCVPAHVLRLRVAAAAGDAAALDEAERAALAALPEDVEVLVTAGLARHERDEHDRALPLLERAFALDPHYPGLLGKIGSVVARAGCPDETMQAMEARTAARPEDWLALYVRSACAHYRREYPRCVEGLERVRPHFPNEPRIYIYLGMTYFYLGQQERAEEVLRQGADVRPQDPDFFYVRSNVLRAKDRAAAIADYERYLEATSGGREFAAKRQRVEQTLAALREGRTVWSAVVLDEIRSARGAVPADMASVGALPVPAPPPSDGPPSDPSGAPAGPGSAGATPGPAPAATSGDGASGAPGPAPPAAGAAPGPADLPLLLIAVGAAALIALLAVLAAVRRARRQRSPAR